MPERDYNALVRQLRAKADSTNFPDEADALRAKADAIESAHKTDAPPPPKTRHRTNDMFFSEEEYAAMMKRMFDPMFNINVSNVARQAAHQPGWKIQDGNIPPRPMNGNIADMDNFIKGFEEGGGK